MDKKTFPSFGAWIEAGATTTWENWNGNGSHNHPMFGGGLVWFGNTLAGVNNVEEAPGYRHIEVRPIPVEKEYSATYSYKTPYGVVTSSVKNSKKSFDLTVTIPVGSYATVELPYSGEVYQIDQGTYKFSVKK